MKEMETAELFDNVLSMPYLDCQSVGILQRSIKVF